MDLANALALIALIASFALWLFNPAPVRRFLRLEAKPEPEPIVVGMLQLADLRGLPLLKNETLPDEGLTWIAEEWTTTKAAEGFAVFRTARTGQRVVYHYPGPSSTRSVLMWQPGFGPNR